MHGLDWKMKWQKKYICKYIILNLEGKLLPEGLASLQSCQYNLALFLFTYFLFIQKGGFMGTYGLKETSYLKVHPFGNCYPEWMPNLNSDCGQDLNPWAWGIPRPLKCKWFHCTTVAPISTYLSALARVLNHTVWCVHSLHTKSHLSNVLSTFIIIWYLFPLRMVITILF